MRVLLELTNGSCVHGTFHSVNDRAVFLVQPRAVVMLRRIMGVRLLRVGVSPARIPWARFVREKLAVATAKS